MKTENIKIHHIPAVLWGEKGAKLFLAVHGNMSSKTDMPIAVLAEEVTGLGYQVLSFDLPGHGDRKDEPTLCNVQNCIPELKMVMDFAKSREQTICLYANSMGAYFSLVAYKHEKLEKCLFHSPVVDMERIITNMMTWFSVSEEQLFKEKEIETPIGQTLYWDYYQFVKQNRVDVWNNATAILLGEKDTLCEYDIVSAFAQKFGCLVDVAQDAEHYFHTTKDMGQLRDWIRRNIM